MGKREKDTHTGSLAPSLSFSLEICEGCYLEVGENRSDHVVVDDEAKREISNSLIGIGFASQFKEFKCEMCGNHGYWGLEAFERHFKEWRHQHGLRCLGFPNSENFNEITSI
ncbi:hypothetical protein IFM89_038031 [Coptis chinensis]|uniref:Splicing factor SF3a60 /Prp9 subunit C-terminal domain-containing protein n=1 Tax=Coptis chinensis TaxID=261450 RepID=A0A835LQ22_9MAGN|nr:hypothetical protein IFM89_038031 [Coptis chinensis]